ncbi:MAG: hypothetical protein VXY83_05905 [Pseudomonadota bacterium]|nr:hypothetical protein [Pseudomonadota bacterium]MEC8467878.1 hypothetical protein [Pseudomonadota bacterium]
MNTAQKLTIVKGLIISAVKHVSQFTPSLKKGECTDIEAGILTSQLLQTPTCDFLVGSIKRHLNDKGIQVKTSFEPVIGESYHKLKIEVI